MKRKKSFLVLLLACIISICAACFIAGCGDKAETDTDSSTSSSASVLTEAQAISTAQESKEVRDKIAAAFESYKISWGTARASYIKDAGDWYVQLSGSILGYMDKYQSNFTTKKFNATLHVSTTGVISAVQSKWVS